MKERICDCCGKMIIGRYKTLTIENDLTNISDTYKYFLCSEVCLSKKIEEVSKSTPKRVKQQHTEKNKEYEQLEQELIDYLGTRVKIKNKKIEINYENENDLNRILEIINFSK